MSRPFLNIDTRYPIRKMQGTGNDFIVLMDPEEKITARSATLLCRLHYGVGADGLIAVTKSRIKEAAFWIELGLTLVESLPDIRPVTYGVIHGDPKLENFLFGDQGSAEAIIDLDTLRHGALIWELADGLRSWAAVRKDDDEIRLKYDILKAAGKSYHKHGLALTDEEWAHLPAAISTMALNLARRYLRDYFEESYFAWDRARYPSLARQNLKRGAAMVSLARQVQDMEIIL